MRQSKLLLHIWSFGGFQNMKNTNFRNPVFNKQKDKIWWHIFLTLKTWNIQLILAKIYLETSKTKPSTCLLKVIFNIFDPSPKTPKFLWHRTKVCKNFFFKSMLSNFCGTEPKHVKTSFLKACLAICIENIQHDELKDQLTTDVVNG